MNRNQNGCTPDCKCSWCKAVNEDAEARIVVNAFWDIGMDATLVLAFNRVVSLPK